jgi:hypothetical protein
MRFRTIVIAPVEGSMVFVVLAILLAITMWSKSGPPAFLRGFATLVEDPEFVDGGISRWVQRWFLKGQFRGRKVVILFEQEIEREYGKIVVSMETHATGEMETHDFTGYSADREGELALFALDAKHDLKLRLGDGCLKALYAPPWPSLVGFAPRFDARKKRSVLEAMDTLAGSLERRQG